MREISAGGKVGQIKISDEVLAIISGTAAHEVEGVISSRASNDMFARSKRNFARNVKINVNQDRVIVDIRILVRFGYRIHEISEDVQRRVKTALETMVGMKVQEVNVSVIGIHFDQKSRSGALQAQAARRKR